MSPSSDDDAGTGTLERAVATFTQVLLSVAQGDFAARAPRSLAGDPVDVLAFLINAAVEEIGELVHELERQREELRKTRNELELAEKLGALGQLAAGVAHELNQPLTAVRVATELLLERGEAPVSSCAPELQLVSEAARRMGRIVDGIRTFARGGQVVLREILAADPATAALALLADELRAAGVRVDLRIDAVTTVHADPDRLQQVLVNLIANSRDAIAGVSSPTIGVSVTTVGDHVRYAVDDNGPGIAPEQASRIFDPFFTTKPAGRGMGLGLAISHGIVTEHGGVLRFACTPASGTRFWFDLLASKARPAVAT